MFAKQAELLNQCFYFFIIRRNTKLPAIKANTTPKLLAAKSSHSPLRLEQLYDSAHHDGEDYRNGDESFPADSIVLS